MKTAPGDKAGDTVCVCFLPPPASGPVHRFEAVVLLGTQDRSRLCGQIAVVQLRKDELLGDELPRGLPHDQLRGGAVAPVPPYPHLRFQHQLHVSCQRHHESRGPFLQKDVERRFRCQTAAPVSFFYSTCIPGQAQWIPLPPPPTGAVFNPWERTRCTFIWM